MDVLVLGGGIAGLMAAHYLARAGFGVAVVDAGPRGGFETSKYNAGLLEERRSFTEIDPVRAAIGNLLGADAPVGASIGQLVSNAGWVIRALRVDREGRGGLEERILRRSLALWDELAREGHVSFYSRRGVRLYADPSRAEEVARETGGRALDRREVEELGFRGFGGGVLDEGSRWVNPHEVLEGMRAALAEEGVRILRGEAALAAEEGGLVRAIGVEARADSYVVAAGAWSDALCGRLGCRLGVLPARGVAVIAGYGSGSVGLPALMEELGIALGLHGGSALRITGYFELAGYSPDVSSRARRLLSRAGGRLAVGGLRPLEVGAGLRPCAHDQLPVVGAVPGRRNLYVATGGCRRGMTVAPLMGDVLARIMSGAGIGEDERRLGPERLLRRPGT
ncbi:MAG: NAD(P)/FAD-dependent oxidoreductase [Conexivisphaera sp.]